MNAKELAAAATPEFFETFIREYARTYIVRAVDDLGCSHYAWGTHFSFNISAEKADWSVYLSKNNKDESTKHVYSLAVGFEETVRRMDFHASQPLFLADH